MAARKTPAKKKAVVLKTKKKGAAHTSAKNVATVQDLIESGFSISPAKQVRYTREIGAEICIRIASGESLNRITRDEHMPHKASVLRWVAYADDSSVHKDEELRKELLSFRDHYEYARILQAENFIDEMIDVADDGRNDWMEKVSRNGEVFEVPDTEVLLRSKLRVETRKWLGEVYLPKVQAMRKSQIDLRSKQPIVLKFDSQDEDA